MQLSLLMASLTERRYQFSISLRKEILGITFLSGILDVRLGRHEMGAVADVHPLKPGTRVIDSLLDAS